LSKWLPLSQGTEVVKRYRHYYISGLGIDKIKTFADSPHTKVIAVAGGKNELRAIQAALRGRLLNILITDVHTGEALFDEINNQ